MSRALPFFSGPTAPAWAVGAVDMSTQESRRYYRGYQDRKSPGLDMPHRNSSRSQRSRWISDGGSWRRLVIGHEYPRAFRDQLLRPNALHRIEMGEGVGVDLEAWDDPGGGVMRRRV